MKSSTFSIGTSIILLCVPAGILPAQQSAAVPPGGNPIFSVHVVQRSAQAVNYQYRSHPTTIDVKGTLLLPKARGEASVKSLPGRTEVDAHIEGLSAPQNYGREYLTYVLWAITPEGRAHNLGELIPDASNKAKIHVTTDFQAFALIVTAEPYAAVREPSDVVVAENQVRPDTIGKIEPVEVKYELLPRGQYIWMEPNAGAATGGRKVSMHEYEARTEIYQAQNAIAIAKAADAAVYARETLAKASDLLTDAERIHDRHGDFRTVVQNAREAAQTAEDARSIALRVQQDEQRSASSRELSQTRSALTNARQAEQQAIAEAQRAKADAQSQATQFAAQSKADDAAREAAEADAAAARQSAVQAKEAQVAKPAPDPEDTLRRERRERILAALKGAMPAIDSTRGLVITLHEDSFRGSELRQDFTGPVARIATILAVEPGLHITVEGYSDNSATDALASGRADSVKLALIAGGLPSASVTAEGRGDTRPVEASATAEGRKANSRVEIVVSGNAIGDMPLWDHPYPLTSDAVSSASTQ